MPKPKPLHYSNSNPNHSLAPNYSLPFFATHRLYSTLYASLPFKNLNLFYFFSLLLFYSSASSYSQQKTVANLSFELNRCKTKKHTALTIPVWSPTTVLGKPNPAWLRSSDGIRYIQGGMTVWCRYSLFIALIPKPKNFSFTSSYSLLYYRHSLFFQQPISVTHFFFAYFYYQKIPESAMIFLYFNYTHLLFTSTQTSLSHFQSVTSCGVQRSSVELCLRSVPRYHRNISRYFWNHIELNSRRVHPTTIRVRQNMGTTLPVVTSTFLKKVEKPFLQVKSNSAELSRSSAEFSRFMARKCSKIS